MKPMPKRTGPKILLQLDDDGQAGGDGSNRHDWQVSAAATIANHDVRRPLISQTRMCREWV